MRLKQQTLASSVLWCVIAIFLAIWLGGQLYGAAINQEIQDLRVTNIVSFSVRPIWFGFVVTFKAVAWFLAILVIYKYVKSKLSS